MAGIASSLISAYEVGQDRRHTLIERQRADDKQSRLDALYLKLQPGNSGQQPKGGDPQSGGVAGAYASPVSPAAPSQPAMPTGAGQPGIPSPAPVASTQVIPEHQTFLQQHGDTISQIMGIDPAQGAQLVANFSKLDEAQKAQIKQANDYMGSALSDIARTPDAQRPAKWDNYVRNAQQSGMTIPPHYLHYSPQAMQGLAAETGVTDALFKEFAPKYVNVVPGTVPQDANPLSGGNPFGGGAAPVQATDKATYDALPPGTPFIAPDGSHRVKPGGVAVGATANRPSPQEFAQFKASLRPDMRDAAQRAYDSGDLDTLPTGSPLSPGNNPARPVRR